LLPSSFAHAFVSQYFDDIRAADCVLPGDKALPALFNFSRAEVKHMGRRYAAKLIPPHARLPFDVEAILDGAAFGEDEADVYEGYKE
jgi:hypothetical protein